MKATIRPLDLDPYRGYEIKPGWHWRAHDAGSCRAPPGQEARSGGSYLSQSDLRVHFGLGSATKIDRIKVRWPSGAVDKIKKSSADRFLRVEEGRGVVQELPH